ncbi:MAG: hypothetical protein EA367_18480 [Leptolyngbya sp. DLM2.Bin15]|nr:MAG: hypothetical protein EA367_18480 [Leptolyngbya sp. DLM2.Bin15]
MVPDSGIVPTATKPENLHGLMRRREASINNRPIIESDRRFFWDTTALRPQGHLGLINSPI